MTCPVCHETMRSVMLDNQEILHCANCGTSFFEDNGINRISIDKAKQLSQERYSSGLTIGHNPTCPRDESVLKIQSGTDSIPSSVRLFICPECHGLLASADDLELFKRAQLSKLDYFKAWNIPLGSLRGVLAIGLLLLLSGSVYWSYNTITRKATIQSEAQESINNIDVSYSGRYMHISFRTKIPLRASLIVDNKTTHTVSTLPISKAQSVLHSVTISRPADNEDVSYRVRLMDSRGRTVDSKEIELK